jgi:hypothetical protein
MNSEQLFVLLAFLLIGIVVGYLTFLIFRISVHQNKFEWAGALSVVTALAGGGFLSYGSRPQNFAAYGIGFFAGFAAYWRFLQVPHILRGSQVASSDAASAGGPDDESESDVPIDRSRASRLRLPEDPHDLIRTITDLTAPAADRVRALLALRTGRHSEDISIGDPLVNFELSDFDLFVLPALLRTPFPQQYVSVEFNLVGDLVSAVENRPTSPL